MDNVSSTEAQIYNELRKTITYSYLNELKARLDLYFETFDKSKSAQDQNNRDIHAIKHVLSLLDRIK